MEPRTLQSLAADCGGEVRGQNPDAIVRRVCTDTRALEPGDLFVCLVGPNFDGHHFAAAALQRGAVAVLGEAARLAALADTSPRILVTDSRRALGRLAAAHRQRFAIPVVAIAGSNGKTTTKELVASVARQRFSTLASEASFNNDIGVPLTLLQLDSRHEAAVVEVGTNHPGELRALLQIVRPTHGVLTRLGGEHLEFFGSLDGVIEEEGTLAEFVAPDGALVMIGECVGTGRVAARCSARIIRVGWAAEDDWSATAASLSDAGTDFEVRAPRGDLSGEYQLRLLGRHQVENALLALAVGAELGLNRAELAAGLQSCAPARRRMQPAIAGGVRIIDDSYNANTDSVRAALTALRDLAGAGRRVAVLGDMAELGGHAAEAHREVGAFAARMGVDALFAVGRFAPELAAAARAGGVGMLREFEAAGEAAAAAAEFLRPGDVVLVKASRATRLDVVADDLKRALGGRREACAPAGRSGQGETCFTI